ncbi:MAG: uracil-DNA glycosylase, partial [Clostridia bacterium]
MIGNDWDEILKREFISDYYIKLNEFLDAEYAQQNIFPPRDDVFTALKLTPFSSVKVVILGQDPYHGFGQAHGLAFSVKPGVAIPPSLRNIFKELNDDLGVPIPDNGCLLPWAREGVLLLNTA